MSIASSETYYVFAVPSQNAEAPNTQWRTFEPLEDPGREAMHTELALYPLQRGPSGHPRFLADFKISGCAGSYGQQYDAHEWDPEWAGSLTKIINHKGHEGYDRAPLPEYNRAVGGAYGLAPSKRFGGATSA